jgi:hypothetical protein
LQGTVAEYEIDTVARFTIFGGERLLFWLSATSQAPDQKGSLDGLDAKRKRLKSAIQEIVQNP